MLDRLSDFAYTLLRDRAFKNDTEIYQYYILLAAAGFGLLTYFGLFLFFLLNGIWALCVLDLCALALMIPFVRLVLHRQRFRVAGLVFSLFFTATTTVHLLLLGTGVELISYYILIAALQFITPYAGFKARGAVVAVLAVCVVGTTVRGFFVSPVYPLGGWGVVLALYNIFLGFAGVCVMLLLVSTVRNVVARYNAERLSEMTDLANSDALTGLYNRHYAYQFFETLRTEPLRKDWCVAMLDIDNFKALNDRHGHEAGDVVLANVAEVLRTSLRGTDLVIRWGGEEFLLVLNNADLAAVQGVLNGLRRKIAGLVIENGGKTLSITVTMGLAKLDLGNVEESIRQCDKKLYEGKAGGKNIVVV